MSLAHSKIIIADDDVDDRDLIKRAFSKLGLADNLKFVYDGEDLMTHLNEGNQDLTPSIIFLDLNMPRKDGRQALKEIKDNEEFRKIPVIIFTTSKSNDDIDSTYGLGANCFITKPKSFSELVKTIENVVEFWFQTATLPKDK